MLTGLENKKLIKEGNELSLWEYLLVAHPDEVVNEQINIEKKYFVDTYQQQVPVTKPHIAIANFSAKEQMEETLIRWIQKLCNHQPAFLTSLNNFTGSPPHAIYLRVQDPQPFKQLANNLKVIENFISTNGCPPVKFIAPHLTIACTLPEQVYEKAIKDYAARLFHASFSVNSLVLIKRKQCADAYKHVNIFPLAQEFKNLFN